MAQNSANSSTNEIDLENPDCDSTLCISTSINCPEKDSHSILDLSQVSEHSLEYYNSMSLESDDINLENISSLKDTDSALDIDSVKPNCARSSVMPDSSVAENALPLSLFEENALPVSLIEENTVAVSTFKENIPGPSVNSNIINVSSTEENSVPVSSVQRDSVPILPKENIVPVLSIPQNIVSISSVQENIKAVSHLSENIKSVSSLPNNVELVSSLLKNSASTLSENNLAVFPVSKHTEYLSPIPEEAQAVLPAQETLNSSVNIDSSLCNSSPNNYNTDEKVITHSMCDSNNSNQSTLQKSVNQKYIEVEKEDFHKVMKYLKDLEARNTSLENEVLEFRMKLNTQEAAFKKAETQIRTEFFSNIEKLSKECNTLRKEKEAIVIRYANSEKEVIKEKKVQQELEKKIKDISKDRDNLLSKIKVLSTENNKLSACKENKTVEIVKLQKTVEKLNADSHSKEIRIKWLQNKLKIETNSHQETTSKLDHTMHRLNEMKEEAEQVRKDCQEMIKCYQEAEEIKSVKLGSQLKQKVSELEVQKQEKTDQEQVYQLLRHELEALKKKQRMTMEENNSLTLKIYSLEKERLEYEQNLSKLKDSQNMLKQEVVDLTARLAEMETLQLQLEREKEKSAASLREVERLRLTNAELQADMNACHVKEGELLKFTEGVTDTNVKLQSAHSLLEVKAQALEDDLVETKKELTDMKQKNVELVSDLGIVRKQHEDEIQLLARKLAEKTKNVEKLNIKLDEAENENRVLKRRHIASIKELSRELNECKKRLDKHESINGIRMDSSSLGSRSSSTASLDVVNSNERIKVVSPATATVFFNGKKETPDSPSLKASSDIPGIDKEMLIERIIKLQKTLARKNDKIDFLEDHIGQLLKEVSKKTKCVDFKTV